MANLELLPQGNGYVLRKTNDDGTARELELTTDDILTINRSAADWDQLVLAKLPVSANPVVATPVDDFALNHDPYGTEVLLEIHRRGKVIDTLAIPVEKFVVLAKKLPSFLQEVADHRKKLQRQ